MSQTAGYPPETPDTASAQVEHQHHRYTGNRIPWYVRLIWLGFWVFAVYYGIVHLLPSMQVELFQNQ